MIEDRLALLMHNRCSPCFDYTSVVAAAAVVVGLVVGNRVVVVLV